MRSLFLESIKKKEKAVVYETPYYTLPKGDIDQQKYNLMAVDVTYGNGQKVRFTPNKDYSKLADSTCNIIKIAHKFGVKSPYRMIIRRNDKQERVFEVLANDR